MSKQLREQQNNSFSLHSVITPRFAPSQIKIDNLKSITHPGFPRPKHKLVVKRSGKIGYKTIDKK